MNWFIVKMVYQIIIGEGKHAAQFDEQMRLIRSTDASEARSKATKQSSGFYETFKNVNGEDVIWKFICISAINEIPAPFDGQEITSTVHEPADPQVFLDHLYKQMAYIEGMLAIDNR